jgi:hypothetical protein
VAMTFAAWAARMLSVRAIMRGSGGTGAWFRAGRARLGRIALAQMGKQSITERKIPTDFECDFL